MILVALLSIPLLQVAEPPVAQAPETSHQQKWWQQLSEEERAQMRKRMDSMREMSPEARKELEGRRKVFEEEKALLIKQLSEEDRARYEALGGREQAYFVRERVHERLRQRGESLRQRFPGMEKGRRAFEESRRNQVMERIAKAGEEGWFGPHALEYLKQAPLHEAMHALMEVQKWQFLEQAQETDFWAKKKINEENQRRISALSAPEFFREIQGLVDGRPKGPPFWHRERRESHGAREGQGSPHGGRRTGGPGIGPPQLPKEGGQHR